MRKASAVKLAIVTTFVAAGFGFAACGGGEQEGGGATTPSAQASSTQTTASTATAPETATASATTPATAPPPAPTLPPEYVAAHAASKGAADKLDAVFATKGTCDAVATAIKKWTADAAPLWTKDAAEYAKLSPEQKKLADAAMTAEGAPAMKPPPPNTPLKGCVDKKDKQVMGAVGAMGEAFAKAWGTATPAPQGSGSAAPKK